MMIALGITITAIVAATIVALAIVGVAVLARNEINDPYE